jgi:endonuclease/exonuclease/phosphatase family metal-dependent hydrolase
VTPSIPGSTPDEAERARFGLYALHQRAAEAATIRAWATEQLQGQGQQRHVLVCGDLNDTLQAATTQVLLGRPGSQLGTGGFNQPDWGTATGCGTWRPGCRLGTR